MKHNFTLHKLSKYIRGQNRQQIEVLYVQQFFKSLSGSIMYERLLILQLKSTENSL